MKTEQKVKLVSLFQQDILSIRDLTKEQILTILNKTEQIKSSPPTTDLSGKILASCFFEPSTRTRLSFESAMIRKGGSVVGFAEENVTSLIKGESLADTIKIIGSYADILVIRHPKEGAARLAAEAASIPVINAGDGANQHPTQALLDLFTIRECQKKLEQLHIAFTGDLLYGRAVQSLVQACSLFPMRFYFVNPPELGIPRQLTDELKSRSLLFSFHQNFNEILPKLDILYMTRIQKERMGEGHRNVSARQYALKLEHLDKAKPNLKIMHPLPRINEIDIAVDETSHAHYFQQAENGVYLRQALLSLILKG
jgi:aspartate carbamoyltransferase catalytic subunit